MKCAFCKKLITGYPQYILNQEKICNVCFNKNLDEVRRGFETLEILKANFLGDVVYGKNYKQTRRDV